MPEIIEAVAELGINTYITGFTKKVENFAPTIEFHNLAREKRINIIAATHYSTEKFAYIAVLDYFKKLRLPCAFVKAQYYLEDLG